MAEFDAETVDALNTLLEDERASVEMEVALASGASEYTERETLVAMGTDDVGFCIALHERLDQAGAPVTRRINGVVFQALGAERYDDRLLVFARHQMMVNDRYRDLPARDLDGETRDLLQTIATTHERQIEWLERRAQAFAASRQLDFRGGAGGAGGATGNPGLSGSVADVERSAPSDPSPAANDGGAPYGHDGAAPDESPRNPGGVPSGRAQTRREAPAPYTPGTPLRGSAERRDRRETAGYAASNPRRRRCRSAAPGYATNRPPTVRRVSAWRAQTARQRQWHGCARRCARRCARAAPSDRSTLHLHLRRERLSLRRAQYTQCA